MPCKCCKKYGLINSSNMIDASTKNYICKSCRTCLNKYLKKENNKND